MTEDSYSVFLSWKQSSFLIYLSNVIWVSCWFYCFGLCTSHQSTNSSTFDCQFVYNFGSCFTYWYSQEEMRNTKKSVLLITLHFCQGLATAIVFGTTMSVAAQLPPQYTTAVMSGINFSLIYCFFVPISTVQYIQIHTCTHTLSLIFKSFRPRNWRCFGWRHSHSDIGDSSFSFSKWSKVLLLYLSFLIMSQSFIHHRTTALDFLLIKFHSTCTDKFLSAVIYFGLAALIIVLAILAYFILIRLPFTRFHMSILKSDAVC
jgi:hypothetical protein